MDAIVFHADGLDVSVGSDLLEEETSKKSSKRRKKEDEGSEEEILKKCLGSWKKWREIWEGGNENAFNACWEKVEKVAAGVMKGMDVEGICAFLKEKAARREVEMMKMAVVYTSLHATDTSLAFQALYKSIVTGCSPHVVTITREQCASERTAIQFVMNRFLRSLQNELDTVNAQKKFFGNSSSRIILEELRASRRVQPARGIQGGKEDQVVADRGQKRRIWESLLEAGGYLMEEKWEDGLQSKTAKSKGRWSSICEIYKLCQTIGQIFPSELGSVVPLVVLIEDGKSIERTILQEVINFLLHWHTEPDIHIHVNVVLGLKSTQFEGSSSLLTEREASRLSIRKFTPPNAKVIVDKLFEKLIIEGKSPLRWSLRAAQWLSTFFVSADFSVNGFLRALQLAAIQHYSLLNSAKLTNVNIAMGNGTSIEDFSLCLTETDLMWISSLKSTEGKLNFMSSAMKIDQIRHWLKVQEENRQIWPHVFKIVCQVQTTLGHAIVNVSARARFADLADKDTIPSLTTALENCSMESLERLAKFIEDTTKTSAFDCSSFLRKFKEARETESKVGSTSSNTSSSSSLVPAKASTESIPAPGSLDQATVKQTSNIFEQISTQNNKKRLRREHRDEVLQKGQQFQSRKIFINWWVEHIAANWDPYTLPLGELFVFNRHRNVSSLLNAKPRAAAVDTLSDPDLGVSLDTGLMYQILCGHRSQHAIPLLTWFTEFCAATNLGKGKRPDTPMTKARFMQSFAELDLLGICTLSKRSEETVKLQIHPDKM